MRRTGDAARWCRRCGGSSAAPTRRSRSPTCARSRRSSLGQTAPRRVAGARARRLRGARGAAGRRRHPRPARLRRREPRRARSACAWRSAPGPATSSAWCCGRACCSPEPGSRSASRSPTPRAAACEALLAGVSPRDAASFALAAAVAVADGARRQPAAGLARGPGRPAEGDPRRLAACAGRHVDARGARPYARNVDARPRRRDKAPEQVLVPRRAARPRLPQSAWGEAEDEPLLDLRLSELDLKIEGSDLQERIAELGAELEAQGPPVPPALLARPTSGSARTACPASRSRSTWPTRGCARLEQHADARGRGRHARVVHDDPAPRGRPRDRERLPAAPAPRSGRRLFGKTRRSPTPTATRPSRTAAASWSTSTPGTRRAIPTRTSPRPSRSGSRPTRTGASATQGWPALRKLEYVDQLMRADRPAGAPASPRAARRSRSRSQRRTLRVHYAAQARHYGVDHREFYDRDLRALFSDAPEHAANAPAAPFLTRIRREVRRRVRRWTGSDQYAIDQVLGDMMARCRELGLRLAGPERGAARVHDAAHGAHHDPPPARPPSGGAVTPRPGEGSAPQAPRAGARPREPGAARRTRTSRRRRTPTGRPSTTWSTRCGHSATRCRCSASAASSARCAPRSRTGSRTSPSTWSRPSTTCRSGTRTWSRYLELMKVPYTGCNSRGLVLARDKALAKKVLSYHRMPRRRTSRSSRATESSGARGGCAFR